MNSRTSEWNLHPWRGRFSLWNCICLQEAAGPSSYYFWVTGARPRRGRGRGVGGGFPLFLPPGGSWGAVYRLLKYRTIWWPKEVGKEWFEKQLCGGDEWLCNSNSEKWCNPWMVGYFLEQEALRGCRNSQVAYVSWFHPFLNTILPKSSNRSTFCQNL